MNPNLNDYLVGFSFTPDDQSIVYDFSCGVWKASLAGPNPAHPTGAGTTQLDSHMPAGTDSAGNSLYCFDDEPAVSPNGQWVAFHNDDTNYTADGTTWTASDNGLWYVDIGGTSAPVHVSGTQYGDEYPAWSPDGQYLSFQSTGPAVGAVTPDGNYYKLMPFDPAFGRGSGMLTDSNGTFGPTGAWTADGSALVVPGTVGGVTSAYTISTDGNETINAVPGTTGANAPQFVGSVIGNIAPVAPAPTVTGLNPTSGPAAGGTSVTITGTGFSTTAGATTIAFGAHAATGVTCNSTTSCTATSPQGSGTVDVRVTVGGQTSAANPPGDQFTYQAPPAGPPQAPVLSDYPPIAAFTDHAGPAGTQSTFDATSSLDPDGSITAWAWNFGDGFSSAGVVATHSYSSPGNYTVTLTVTDNAGLSRSAGATLAIAANQPPVASWQAIYVGPAGTATTFDGASSNDPDDQIVSLVWTFGDGATGYGAAPSHVYAAPGAYMVTLTATDSGGLTGTSSQVVFVSAPGQGYWLAGADGGVFTFGSATYKGSLGGYHLNAPIVALAPTADGQGYHLVGADGGVFAFGDAHYKGSLGGYPLNAPIVAFAPTADGLGYWLVGADGGVFAFGDAYYKGSLGGYHLNSPIVAFAPTADGKGYWMVGADGGVFAFGDAYYIGSLGGATLNAPIISFAPTHGG
ncbi:MAG TPA: PKD domain-containing protein [Acidimicrobiales bacterium]|nr:PKD domain-containing protein [Acidimicrobiales bacterium]